MTEKDDETIPMTRVQLKASIFLGACYAGVIIASVDSKKCSDPTLYRKQIENQIDEIVEMTFAKKPD